MNTRTILRIIALHLCGFIAVIGLLSTPNDSATTLEWVATLLLSKVIGIAALIAVIALYCRWIRTDKWLAGYHKNMLKDE